MFALFVRQEIFILIFFYPFYIPPTDPLSLPSSCTLYFLLPQLPSTSRKDKAYHGESNWDKTKPLPTASRLSKSSHHKECSTKRQIMYQILIPPSRDPKLNQATQLSPTCRRTSPSIPQIAHFISHVLIPSLLPQLTQKILSISYSFGNAYA